MKRTFLKTRNKICFIAVLICLSAVQVFATTLTVTSGTPVTINNTTGTLFDDIIVQPGGVLTIEPNTPSNTTVTVQVVGSLVIEPGGTVTCNSGVTLQVGFKIEVQSDYTSGGTPAQGGILHATGTTFTNKSSQGTYWMGIQVWGMNYEKDPVYGLTTHLPQDYSAKATLSGCTVNNAYVAVSNYRFPQTTKVATTSGATAAGGIIQAFNTYFTNNAEAALFRCQVYFAGGNKVNDKSKFFNCNFGIDNSVTPPAFAITSTPMTSSVFVWLNNVENVRFQGCYFEDPNSTKRMQTAIYAQRAGFTVNSACVGGSMPTSTWYGLGCTGPGSIVPCEFHGIPEAIVAYADHKAYTLVINGATFQENAISNIKVDNYIFPIIVGNSINCSTSHVNSATGFMGIQLTNCIHAEVEDNSVNINGTYNGWNPTGSGYPAVGMVVADAGAALNEVYNNSFANLDYAMESVGQNRDKIVKSYLGLRFLCNNFSASEDAYKNDIISGSWGYPQNIFNSQFTNSFTGLAEEQYYQNANSSYAAGNYFDAKIASPIDPLHDYRHFNNAIINVNQITYFFDNNAKSSNPYVPTETNLINNLQPDFDNSCASRSHLEMEIGYSNFITYLPVLDRSTFQNFNGTLAGMERYVKDGLKHYLYDDSTVIELDTLEAILANTTDVLEYKVMQAAVLQSSDRYDDAIDLLDGLTSALGLDELQQGWVNDLITVCQVAKDLHDNGDDWSAVNSTLKTNLADIAENDGYKAKHLARAYLREFESATYGPTYIWQPARMFEADAGDDEEINNGDAASLEAGDIGEDAVYEWYDMSGTLLHTGASYAPTPTTNTTYRLIVTADADGFSDDDEVTVNVKQQFISFISPNPSDQTAEIHYSANGASTASIEIKDVYGTTVINESLNVSLTNKSVNVSTLTPGTYYAILVCDSNPVDSKNIIIN